MNGTPSSGGPTIRERITRYGCSARRQHGLGRPEHPRRERSKNVQVAYGRPALTPACSSIPGDVHQARGTATCDQDLRAFFYK